MILRDSDVLIDLLREYPPATVWFDTLLESEELVVPGYVVMELIQGRRNKAEQEQVQRDTASSGCRQRTVTKPWICSWRIA